MIAAARLAVATGRCDRRLPDQLAALLERVGLPTQTDRLVATPLLMEAMRLDKKVVDTQLRLVLPDRLGAVSIVGDTPDRLIAQAWDSIRQ